MFVSNQRSTSLSAMSLHVVWDWNCTLFDDLALMARSTSASLVAIGGQEVDVEKYRSHYCRPVDLAYSRLLGREVTHAEMQVVSDVFHETYMEIKHQASLAHDAVIALEMVAATGGSQSLLSMWVHDHLMTSVEELGIGHHFSNVRGQSEATHQSKAASLAAHLDEIESSTGRSFASGDVVMIGDAVDDSEAAKKCEVECVLVSTGASVRSDLVETGWPVCDSLVEAVSSAIAARGNGGSSTTRTVRS